MEKVDYYFCGLMLSILEEMLEKVRYMIIYVRTYLIDIRRFAAAKGLSQRA